MKILLDIKLAISAECKTLAKKLALLSISDPALAIALSKHTWIFIYIDMYIIL